MKGTNNMKAPAAAAYVPPHRRNRKVVTAVEAGAPSLKAVEQSVPPNTTGASRKHHRHHRGKTTTQQQHQYHYYHPRQHHDGENNNTNDDVDFLCSVLTRICCINLQSRPDKWQRILQQARRVHARFADKIERFGAVQGCSMDSDNEDMQDLVNREWDATQNAQYSSRVISAGSSSIIKTMTAGEVGCALSHVQLWKQLLLCQDETTTCSRHDDKSSSSIKDTNFMLILEDDIVFTSKRGKSRFARAFGKAWTLLPSNWSILYLGFSSRGERFYVEKNDDDDEQQQQEQQQHEEHRQSQRHRHYFSGDHDELEIRLYRPTYGFHTHAYVINTMAAATLLEHLPVVGPIDVWLADNAWFGLSVYCAVIANEGWKCEDGTYEGANLVSQDRKHHKSDVQQSAHVS